MALGSSLHQCFFPLAAELLLPRFPVPRECSVCFRALGFLWVQDGAALGCALIELHLSDARHGRLPPLGSDVGHGGVVLFWLLAELRQLLQLCGSSGPLEGSNGGSDAVHPLLLVEDIVGLQRVGLAWGGVLETNSEDIFSFIWIAERSSEGASHFHISILQVFQEQFLHRDGLPVHLVGLTLVASDRPGQNQDVLEEEDVEFLKGKPCLSMRKALYSTCQVITHPLEFKATLSQVSPMLTFG